MTETFSIQVHPNAVNDCIQVYEAFGWSVLSTQEVVRNLPPQQHGSIVEHVTETYNKLTFQRTIDKYTPKLKEYQAKYEDAQSKIASNNELKRDTSKFHFKRALLYVILGIIGFAISPWLSLIGFGLLVTRIVRYILDRKEWHERWDRCYKENERLETRKQEILTESRAYLMTVSTAE